MPRPSSLSPDNILRFLQVTKGAASANEIGAALHLGKAERKALFNMLVKLKKRGAVEELPGGRYRLAGRKGEGESGGKAARSDGHDAAAGGSSGRSGREAGLAASGSTGSGSTGNNPRRAGDSQALARDEVRGRLVLHHDGYGFVVPDVPMPQLDGDVFIPRDAVEDAMHGDHVLAKLQRVSDFRRGDFRGGSARGGSSRGGQRAEGRIVRVLGRAHPSVVGLFRYGPRGNVVLPYDNRIQHEIEIPAGDELTGALREKLGVGEAKEGGARGKRLPHLPELDGAVVNVELLRYPRGGAAATGRVIEILGRPGDLGVDTEIIIRKHHLPHEFSGAVLAEAEHRAAPVSETEREGREDFRHLPIVTIDGETARDFDDAVYVERRADGGWRLQVHIADVAHYVRTGTALDQEARLRGTSVYFPDRAVPMLPEALSNGMCSLKPREERLVMSALMEFDAAGNMQSARMTSGVIRSAERMTYTNVNKVIEGDPDATARYARLAGHFRDMKELALLLNKRRNEHGSIDFDLPEPVIEFDEQQRMTNIVRSERNIAHRLIEEFMLAANRAVDGYLLKRGIPSLHRVHEKPDARKVLEFEELAQAFGYSLGVADLHQREVAVRHGRVPAPAKVGRPDSYGHGRERGMKIALPGSTELRITPQHYQKLLRKLMGKPEERIVSYLMLRSLKQARYAAEPLGHFALGFDEYTHFTSPIRRYPDLIVHRVLKWALEHPQVTAPVAGHAGRGVEATLYSETQLGEIASETSEAERRANGAERELMDWKTAQFMEAHLGEEYEALIISVQKYGCFVELFEVFVEGLLPINALEDAAGTRVVFRERDHAIVALSGSDGRRGTPGSRRGRGAKPKELAWHLGDRVHVRAERIDPMRRRVEFAIAEVG
ncbi:MAG TPA: RNB domain-containing ribonuclease [Candidatus Binatus sp.]|jgi:ribonuclease R|nr:RNB domain-containing ribonuclease [Candidatus Binatus sp.]